MDGIACVVVVIDSEEVVSGGSISSMISSGSVGCICSDVSGSGEGLVSTSTLGASIV